MNRNDRILRALQSGEESAANLARICECPAASVRRSIQELRSLGHNVCHAAHDEQLYRLGGSATYTSSGFRTDMRNDPSDTQ